MLINLKQKVCNVVKITDLCNSNGLASQIYFECSKAEPENFSNENIKLVC